MEPILVMEYLPLGNLACQHQVRAITVEESIDILSQGLQALEYLHRSGHVHRDIKPENLLVSARIPFGIKMADFGLAKDTSASYLRTCAGTYIYTAPEIWKNTKYNNRIDIWSLGLVVYSFVYGLPKCHGKFAPDRWYRKLNESIADWDSETLINFLSSTMLKMDPKDRLSARACLTKVPNLFPSMIPVQVDQGS